MNVWKLIIVDSNNGELWGETMKCDEFKNEIDTLEFEVSNQEIAGKSGSGGWYTAFKLTLAGRCGLCFTCSYECTSNNVHC